MPTDGFNAQDQAGNAIPILCDGVTDGVLGTGQKQLIGVMDATPDSTNKWIIDSSGRGQVFIGGGSVTTTAAGRSTDSVSAAIAIDSVMSGLTAGAVGYAPISLTTGGTSTVVAAVSAKRIIILGYHVAVSTTCTLTWKSHTTTATALGGTPLTSGISVYSPYGIFATVAGEALDITLSTNANVGGGVTYVALA